MARSSTQKKQGAASGGAASKRASGGQNLRGNAGRQAKAQPASAPAVRADGAERDILGVVLGVVAVASFIAVVSPSSAPVTSAIARFYHLGFGLGAYVLPFVILAAAVCLFLRDRSPVSGRTLAGAALVFACVLAWLSLSVPYTSLSTDAMFEEAGLSGYGGYVGAVIASALQNAFGKTIARVILVGAIVGGFVVIGFSISDFVERVVEKAQELRERHQMPVNDTPWGGAADAGAARRAHVPFGGPGAAEPEAAKTTYLGARETSVIDRADAPDVDEDPIVDLSEQLAAERAKTVLIPVQERYAQVDGPVEAAPATGEAPAPVVFAEPPAQPVTQPIETLRPRHARGVAAPAADAARTTVLPAKEAPQAGRGAQAESAPSAEEPPAAPAGAGADGPRWDGPFVAFNVDDDPDDPFEAAAGAAAPAGGAQDLTAPAPAAEDDAEDETPQLPPLEAAGSEELLDAAFEVAEPSAEAVPIQLDSVQDPDEPEPEPGQATLTGSLPGFLAAQAPAAAAERPARAQRREAAAAPAPAAAADGAGEPQPRALPPTSMLRHNPNSANAASSNQELEQTAEALQATLTEFNLHAKVTGWISGPTVTTFKVQPGEGERVSRISNLEDDIALSLAAQSVRIFAPIPGTSLVGIEIPNRKRQNVNLADVLPYVQGGPLELAIGRDAEGSPVVADLAKMPHLLIAGTTGSGKSVMINSIIMTLLMRTRPEDVRLIMVDPKRVELAGYNGLPHLYVPVVTEPKQAASALQWAVSEMERRLKIFERLSVRKISTYNEKQAAGAFAHYDNPPQKMPYLVIIIDELSDLMMVAGKDIEASIVRVAQLGRAAGIHLIVATQRPSSNVVTGLIKANITNRIAFNVATGVDSRVIIDQVGAEKLTGLGDMLFSKVGWGKPKRIQGCFVSDDEISSVVEFVKAQGAPDYHEEILSAVTPAAVGGGGAAPEPVEDDPLLWNAAHIVVDSQLGSTSGLQRRLKVGYARAGRIMDMLEEKGIVGPPDGSKPREVLLDEEGLAALEALEGPLTREEVEGY